MSKDSSMVDPSKIKVVHGCARPTSATEVKSFIGLAGYYNSFIEGLPIIVESWPCLTQ